MYLKGMTYIHQPTTPTFMSLRYIIRYLKDMDGGVVG
jgi:hypothetical protein